MNDTIQSVMSEYHTIATLNREHHIYLVMHQTTGKVYVKKLLDVYNRDIYNYLLKHPIAGVPRIKFIHESDGQLLLIEEYISGTSLQEIMDEQALTLTSIFRYMRELCLILEQLHRAAAPIIHRDIKPSNIIITSCGHVMLLDFNAAKYDTGNSGRDTTLLGTQGYAAPEQYGFGSSTPQTDIYAVGILLKELSRSLPVPAHTFDSIIERCTEMNPADRIQTVQELRNAISLLETGKGYSDSVSRVNRVRIHCVPPGFRTKTPWKMLVASVGYLFIFWISLSMEVKDATVFQLWLERITALLILLTYVFTCLNYCDIQRMMPLCASRRRWIRWLGILLFNILCTVALLIIMLLLESFF